MTNKEKARVVADYLVLSKKAEMFGWIFFGAGLGMISYEFALYKAIGRPTPLIIFIPIMFFFALINYHVKNWALEKANATFEGQNKKVNGNEK